MFRIQKFKVAYKFGNTVKISDVNELVLGEFAPERAIVKAVEEVNGEKKTDTIEFPIDYQSVFIMESTGNYDSQGMLIYSGMVCETAEKKRLVINFADGGYYAFGVENETEYHLLTAEFSGKLTIIGNIYQSPELTEKQIDMSKEIENAEKNPVQQ